MTPKVSIRIGAPPLYNSKQSEIFGENTTKAIQELEIIQQVNVYDSIKKKKV
jgi:hypothetical protein